MHHHTRRTSGSTVYIVKACLLPVCELLLWRSTEPRSRRNLHIEVTDEAENRRSHVRGALEARRDAPRFVKAHTAKVEVSDTCMRARHVLGSHLLDSRLRAELGRRYGLEARHIQPMYVCPKANALFPQASVA
eukprot:6199758-Pleurochrysis_carterae.AAC.2